MRSKIIYPLFIVLFTLVSFEIILRLFKTNITWSEKTGHGYESYYNKPTKSWFHTWEPNSEFDLDNGDFICHYKTNSLGLREKEVVFQDSLLHRIICIGDSYTEGVGAPYDSSYPRFLSSYLNQAGFKNEVYNAGVAASDPFYEYELLKEKLLHYEPQYLLLDINSSDITDYIERGGFGRFKPNGTAVYNKGPWFEPYYKNFYIVRFVLHKILGYTMGNLFLTKHEFYDEYAPRAVQEISSAVDSFSVLAKQNHFKLLVILQPIASDVAYKSEYNSFLKNLNSDFGIVLKNRGIMAINLFEPMKEKINRDNMDQYSYRNDSHYKPAGYDLFTQVLLATTKKEYPNFWADSSSDSRQPSH